jgi:NADH dehydrogenase [ubiquinone] 1 alpha subcomplex assembly factor 7
MRRAMNALFDKLRNQIFRDGPLTVAQYMDAAMTDPDHGYYTTRDPLGARGDFITSPEISQIFGELIGLWCAAVWQSMGSPKAFRWIELGPGRGTLMADAIRATAKVPGFHEAVNLHMVDASSVLKSQQQQILANSNISNREWHNDLSQVPEGPVICIANEFFDALPVRHFQRIVAGWRERMIGLNETKDGLAFLLGNEMAPQHFIPEGLREAPDGALVETSPVSLRIMHTLADRIANTGGAALIIDYGHAESAHGETLQAMQNHKYTDVLDVPGEQDLTAHVDFATLGKIASDAGATVHGPTEQGEFLNNLGLGLRTKALMNNAKSPEQASDVFSGANRLVDADQMGTLFKILGVSSPALGSLPAL